MANKLNEPSNFFILLMPDSDQKIHELEDRLDRLVKTQIDFQKEISLIRGELLRLRSVNSPTGAPDAESFYFPNARPQPPPSKEPVPPRPERPVISYKTGYVPPESKEDAEEPVHSSSTQSSDPFSQFASRYVDNARADLEKFIGENLISKIGIVILVLGVGIGAKYAIDNNLISPLTRIVIGYIFGFGLVGLAIKLKPKYLNFSSVLISGGMAIMYFVTYFAYSSYALMSQLSAFALMAMFTVFTVAAALVYSRQVIAHIGLVGAYAVPFLLSSDSGNYLALFAYMSVINAGILVISLKKNWKPLFYTSSAFTWIIFYGWFATKYKASLHFELALVFLAVFAGIFYATKLGQKMLHEESDENSKVENLVSALATAFIFYAFCLAILANAAMAASQYWIFFSYLAAASVVILGTSFRSYGRAFMYLAVPFVWLTYGLWYIDRYDAMQHFLIAVAFASIFFAIFYFAILFHRLVVDNFTLIEHASLVLSNAFIFYGFGYSIIDGRPELAAYLGLYTAAHAGLHFGVAHIVSRIRSDAVDVVQVLTILVLTFASIAIPVQFDGNAVTMIWAVEAALLFWFGRTRTIKLFEYFSYPVMILATLSLFVDWWFSFLDRNAYTLDRAVQPITNGDYITAAVFVAAFAFICITNRDHRHAPAIPVDLVRPVGLVVAAVATFVLWNMFRLEIENYFHLRTLPFRSESTILESGPYLDLGRFNLAWQLNYTLLFLCAMAAANLKRLRSTLLAFVNTGLSAFALVAFATVGMFIFSELRIAYGVNAHEPVFASWLYIAIRPISCLFAATMLYWLYRYSRDEVLAKHYSRETLALLFEGIAYSFIFVVASCELVNLMGQFGIGDATKLGLSILWGVYALALIVIGIAWDKKHLRISAMVLLAVTLAKLFFYDIADLDTIPKTILFVTLGITLLVVSFLYNKYKDVIVKKGASQE